MKYFKILHEPTEEWANNEPFETKAKARSEIKYLAKESGFPSQEFKIIEF